MPPRESTGVGKELFRARLPTTAYRPYDHRHTERTRPSALSPRGVYPRFTLYYFSKQPVPHGDD